MGGFLHVMGMMLMASRWKGYKEDIGPFYLKCKLPKWNKSFLLMALRLSICVNVERLGIRYSKFRYTKIVKWFFNCEYSIFVSVFNHWFSILVQLIYFWKMVPLFLDVLLAHVTFVLVCNCLIVSNRKARNEWTKMRVERRKKKSNEQCWALSTQKCKENYI